jgi:hypothetical protein
MSFDQKSFCQQAFGQHAHNVKDFARKLTGDNLGRVYNSRCGRACLCHAVTNIAGTT